MSGFLLGFVLGGIFCAFFQCALWRLCFGREVRDAGKP